MTLTGIPAPDAAVMEFVQNHMHNTVTDAVFPILTYLGEAGAVWIALALTLLNRSLLRAEALERTVDALIDDTLDELFGRFG